VAFVVEHTHEIAASAADVWRVISDLDRYPEWNPFVVQCRSTLVPGTPIVMRVRVLPWFAQSQTERVFEYVPGRRLRYGIDPLPFGALASSRSHEVEALGPDRARYVSHFELRGWLAPIVELLLGRRLADGFAAMSSAIAARAEELKIAPTT
jgi:hypothetical protein